MAQFHGTEVDVVNGGFLFVQRATTLFFRVSLPSVRWMALGEACFRLALSKTAVNRSFADCLDIFCGVFFFSQ